MKALLEKHAIRLLVLDFDYTLAIPSSHVTIEWSDEVFLKEMFETLAGQVAIASFGQYERIVSLLRQLDPTLFPGTFHPGNVLTSEGVAEAGGKNRMLAELSERYHVQSQHILLLDDNTFNVHCAIEAGYKALLVPEDCGLTSLLWRLAHVLPWLPTTVQEAAHFCETVRSHHFLSRRSD